MTAVKQHIIIKGTKDGLIFVLGDQCEFSELLKELEHKLEKTHHRILSGPAIHVSIKLGKRIISDKQREAILDIFSTRDNLIVQSIESQPDEENAVSDQRLTVLKGIVRSGQNIVIDGDLLYIGDINPGGTVVATGNIYIMGALKGMAHSGSSGNESAIIAASLLSPTQLRIAGVISRPPDEWGISGDTYMEFAYLKDGQMEIDKLVHLHQIRPGTKKFIGE